MWTKSACVVLAWGILFILMAGGMRGSGRPDQAIIRIASSTASVTPTSNLNVAAASAEAINPGARHVRQTGRKHSVRYTVAAGDTLSGIAAALAVPGGWPALYAANRRVIGPDPNMIHPGTVLTVSRPAASASPVSVPLRPAVPRRLSDPAPPPAPAPIRHHAASAETSAPAAVGAPGWLTAVLLSAGLLTGAVCLTELALGVRHWRRPPVTPGRPCTSEGSRIILADYGRLVVTQNKSDGTVYVLRPPGEDPGAILRVARLVLKEDLYRELAARLGVPANWPGE
jgi:LysM domain-containing protein